jgi:hypothetical protein
MSWTTVVELPMTSFEAGKAVDVTAFHNDALMLGGIVGQLGHVSFPDVAAQLEIPVRDDSLQRFTAIRIEARIRPSAIPRRLNIVEGWMAFAFFVEANRQLVGSIYDCHNWVMVTGTTPVQPGRWSSVAFDYDGISIARLTLDGATVGSSVAMPMGMYQPQQVVSIGHWPRGDGRYTFMGEIGHVRILRRDYEDYGRDALRTAFCGRKLTPAQASALRELQVLHDLLDERTRTELRDCAKRQTERLLELMRRWRAGNARDIARLRLLGGRLRAAWCCRMDHPHVTEILLEFMRQRAGAPGSPERMQFEADYQEIVALSRLCLKPHPILDRMRELVMQTSPDLAGGELAFAQLEAIATGA